MWLAAGYIENMGQMVELARQRKMEPILFTLPPIDSQRYFRFFSRGIEKWRNILQWLGSVDVIYEQHKMYSEQYRPCKSTAVPYDRYQKCIFGRRGL